MEGAAEICPTHFRGLASRAETLLVTGNCMKIPGDSMAARVALVTGAASGIGRARSGLLAAAAALGRRRDYVVAYSGGNGRWVGIRQRTALESRCTIEINLTGSFLTRRAAVPARRRVGGGALVLIGVVNGTRRVSNLGATAKAAAKAGPLPMRRALARDKIWVDSMCPGAIRTAILAGSPPGDAANVRYRVNFPAGAGSRTGGHVGETQPGAGTGWFLLSDWSSPTKGTEVFVDGAQALIQGRGAGV